MPMCVLPQTFRAPLVLSVFFWFGTSFGDFEDSHCQEEHCSDVAPHDEDVEDSALLHLRLPEGSSARSQDDADLHAIWRRIMDDDLSPEELEEQASLLSTKFESMSSHHAASQASAQPLAAGTCPTGAKWQNFDQLSWCSQSTTMYCPSRSRDIVDIVKSHTQVRATGLAHSWGPFPCTSGPARNAATIGTGRLDKILGLNSARTTVRVQPGVHTRDLLEYTLKEGLSLKNYPWFIDQTVGGAVATGSHGSDFLPGRQSMSAGLHSIDLILANGTQKHVDREKDPELMRAVGISVGKLGVTVELEFDVEEDYCLRGTVRNWNTEAAFLNWLSKVSGPNGHLEVQDPAKNHTAYQIMWYSVSRTFLGGQQTKNPAGCKPGDRDMNGGDEPWLRNSGPKAAASVLANMKRTNPRGFERTAKQMAQKYTFCTEDCWASTGRITNTLLYSQVLIPDYKYEQWEFLVPLEKAHGCMNRVFNGVLNSTGSRTVLNANPVLMRFMGKDDHLLSYSSDGDHMAVNMDFDVSYRSHTMSECNVMDDLTGMLLSQECSGRLHWGKHGWDAMDYNKAKAMYPDLPEFVRHMKDWDPEGKFVGSSPVFDPQAPPINTGRCQKQAWWATRPCNSPQRQASRCACTAQGATCEWILPPQAGR